MTIDKWRPSASLDMLRRRDELYQELRRFFQARHYLEVDVPLLGSGGTTDPHIQSFCSTSVTPIKYLQTSPEFAMKRLLAAGSGPIFALTKSFRLEEQGKNHNPEFTILEWYRPGFDDHALMQEVGELLGDLLRMQICFCSYRDLFLDKLSVNPHSVTLNEIKQLALNHIDIQCGDEPKDFWLDLLFTHVIQPSLNDKIYFVFDYPSSQAALARTARNAEGELIARRFEVFVNALELANGYWELTDAYEQVTRFDQDNLTRDSMNNQAIMPDYHLVAALKHGMPDAAGVAMGVDRLLMLITQSSSIDQVIAFPFDRA